MKTNVLKSIALLAVLFTVGCSSDDDNTTATPTNNLVGTVLSGNITQDLNIPTGSYTIAGAVRVKSGATLTIQPGTTFMVTTADQAAGDNYLQIEQGAKINAVGTATSPIVFTAQSGNVGAWGGIIINGKAKINVAGGTEIAEAGGLIYGGTDDTDNSGTLKYVRVEYAGAAVSGGTGEFNAFSFNGLGSGTVLENLQAYKGADDGFEFFGGVVAATNLASFGMEDDNVDWDRGYRGTITNVWIKQPTNGDYGFECSNLPVEYNSAPRSNPTASNITIEGTGKVNGAAFRFKEGTAGTISNVVATNVGYGAELSNQTAQFEDGTLKVTNANITFITGLTKNGVSGSVLDITSLFTINTGATGANTAPFTLGTWVKSL